MTDKMKSFVKGILLGLVSRAVMPKGEPVAFLYNGVRLPKLPDVEGHPFRFIRHHPLISGAYSLYCFTEIEYLPTDDNNQNIVVTADNLLYFDTLDAEGSTVTGVWAAYEYDADSVAFQDFAVWANFTMYNLDGSICIEPSDPVPVYE